MRLRQQHRELPLQVIATEAEHYAKRLGSGDAQAAFRRFFEAK